eukprot:587972_1
MSQQEITLPKKKFSQLCMNVMETFKSMQEIMGADHLNESHDEDHDEFIERNILSQMTTCEIDSLRSGLHTARSIGRKLEWPQISSALMHELDEGVSRKVMKVVEELNISTVSLSEAMENELNKEMTKHEIHYIRNLIDRSIQNTNTAPPSCKRIIESTTCCAKQNRRKWIEWEHVNGYI